jgi:YHS domain-containing protein
MPGSTTWRWIGFAVVIAMGMARPAVIAWAQCCSGNGRAKADLFCPVEPNCPIYDKRRAPSLRVDGQTIYLCSPECIPKLKAEPARYLKHSFLDPVASKWFRFMLSSPKEERNGALYVFMSPETRAAFDRDPARYIKAGP